ncbi:hypothetical protein ABPG74_005602 [Tetrahymena malaccensis]
MTTEAQQPTQTEQSSPQQKNIRLSESYPPTSTNNSQYLADVHEVIKNIDLSNLDLNEKITIREINPLGKDIDQLKVLYKEWFPLNYDDTFWNKVSKQQVEGYVAELDLASENLDKYIVGAVVFYEKEANRQDLGFCIEYFFNKLQTIYIQTIGVINELRQYKIGTKLLDKVKDVAQRRKNIKYISLHMVEYNQSGETFYLKNGFNKVRTIFNLFKLEEKFYNFFYFCFYVNGGSNPHQNFWMRILQKIRELFRKLAAFIKSLY